MFDDLDPKLMLVTGVLFLILIWVLNNILYKPLLNFMSNREDGIKEDENKINQNNSDVNNNEILIGKIYADARAKSQSIKNEHIKVAKDKAADLVNKKKLALDEEFSAFTSNLMLEKEKFKNELREELVVCNAAIKSNLDRI